MLKSPKEVMEGRLALSKIVTLTCYTLLIALYTITTLLGDYEKTRVQLFLLGLQVIPLLCLLSGILKESYKAHLWLCFILLLYFTVVVTRLFMPNVAIEDWIELSLLSVLFIASMMFARWKQHLSAF